MAPVKASLTVDQIVRLLRGCGESNLPYVGWLLATEIQMNTETNLFARVGQALLAVGATGATVLALQLAMVLA
jgi:hypothetical protein